jgi:hypothetical protein
MRPWSFTRANLGKNWREHLSFFCLFVKDTNYHNDATDNIPIISSMTGAWFKLALTISTGQADDGFDPTHIQAIGIRIATYPGATLDFTGSFYIDSCSIVG